MQRLAALVPRPRLHLIRFHGVQAHNAKLRALVVRTGLDWMGTSGARHTTQRPAHGDVSDSFDIWSEPQSRFNGDAEKLGPKSSARPIVSWPWSVDFFDISTVSRPSGRVVF